jgi:hypothetical protein
MSLNSVAIAVTLVYLGMLHDKPASCFGRLMSDQKLVVWFNIGPDTPW